MTKNFHGGKRSRKNNYRKRRNTMKGGRKSRRSASRRSHRRNSRRSRRNNMRGGSASYPNEFSTTLPQNMHEAARITSLDKAFAQLPEFAGKYGTGQAGGRRTRRRMYGGMADVKASAMILSPAEEPKAFLNPQWYTENQVVPSFKGPENALAASNQHAAQQTYTAKGGKRRGSRKHRKSSRRANRK